MHNKLYVIYRFLITLKNIFKLYLFVYLSIHTLTCTHVHVLCCTHGSQINLWDLVLTFSATTEDQTQLARLGGLCPYPLNCPAGPHVSFEHILIQKEALYVEYILYDFLHGLTRLNT